MNLPTISKTKLKKVAAKVYNKTRRELLIEKGEQLLDELTVKRIMDNKKKED